MRCAVALCHPRHRSRALSILLVGTLLALTSSATVPGEAASTPSGVLQGRIRDARTGVGIATTVVLVGPVRLAVQTSPSGFFSVAVRPGRYEIWVRARGALSRLATTTVRAGQVTRTQITLPTTGKAPGPRPSPTPQPTPTPTPQPGPTATPRPQPTSRPPSGDMLPCGTTRVSGLRVQAGETLAFNPSCSTTLESAGNVIVEGRLISQPNPGVVHVLRFVGIREDAFVGGGMDPVPTDVGLWVMAGGVLDFRGQAKTAWTRLVGAAQAGQTMIEVQDADNWQVGDELVITATVPWEPGEANDFWRRFDRRRIASLAGNRIALDAPLSYPHPAVVVNGRTYTAEVLNLTRNVRIEGTPSGRTHVFIRSDRPQDIRYVEIAWTGPRRPNPNDPRLTDGVLGRYGLHFHMMGDASRGTVVEGVVVRDSGGHAFVPHGSHGITLRWTISHDTMDTPYWWDPGGSPHHTHEAVWEHAVASFWQVSKRFPGDVRATREAGFSFGRGLRNVARNLVAANGEWWGFVWPEGQSDDNSGEGVWTWEGGVAHNTRRGGIFTWQNTRLVHVVTGFVGYHQERCIEHGAYANPYRYERFACYGSGPVLLHAIGDQLVFRDGVVDLAGRFPYALRAQGYVFPGPVLFERITWRGYTHAAVQLDVGSAEREAVRWRLVDNTFGGNEAWLADTMNPGHVVEIRDGVHGALELRRRDQSGTYFEPRWNARVTRL
jgi:hypothetical protein